MELASGSERGLQLHCSPNKVVKHKCAAPAPARCSHPPSQNQAQSLCLQHLGCQFLQQDVTVIAACVNDGVFGKTKQPSEAVRLQKTTLRDILCIFNAGPCTIACFELDVGLPKHSCKHDSLRSPLA